MNLHSLRASIGLGAIAILATACSSTAIIDSDPQGAVIYVDGTDVGKTPVSYAFSTTELRFSYEVRAELDGHETDVQDVRSHTDFWGSTQWPNRIFFRLRRKATREP